MDAFDGLQFHMHKINNKTFHATVIRPGKGGHRYHHHFHDQRYDDAGALYYVVAVVLIYGISIVMLIASHIKKNKMDNHISIYLKEIAVVRKQTRRDQVLCATVKSTPPMIQKTTKESTLDTDSSTHLQGSVVSLNLYESEASLPSSPFATQLSVNTREEVNKFPEYSHVRFIDEDAENCVNNSGTSPESERNVPLLKIS
ncbi:uncharacterized protein LOC141900443 [Tubulanus polymorphus]|uniref:uncharacterized protein LOC141900443 n=1 Tax=Tubulanus polymorphus TaxID=672921 RepID=UPI003DA32F73